MFKKRYFTIFLILTLFLNSLPIGLLANDEILKEEIPSDVEYSKGFYEGNHNRKYQNYFNAETRSGNCNVVYLMNCRVADIYESLRETFSNELSDGKITISKNEITNSIIIRKSDDDVEKLVNDVKDMIHFLDFQTGQVLIDVLIVELTIDDSDVLNAEWKQLFANPLGQSKTMVNAAVDHGLINHDDPMSQVFGAKAFVTSGAKMKAFLNAYKQKNKITVLSSPHVVTANHREAIFKTGQKMPLIESTRPSTNGPINSYKVEDVGLELTVTPHIFRSGEVDLEVHQVINALQKYDEKTCTATMSNREAKTNLTLKSGDTMILGGFIEERTIVNQDKIPLLSEIPVLGKAFISTQKSKEKTEIMVFITPRILDTREDGYVATKTLVSRTSNKSKVLELLRDRNKTVSAQKSTQDILIERSSTDWEFALNTDKINQLCWSIPKHLDTKGIVLDKKGSAPFGFGSARKLLPVPIKTLLDQSKGGLFRKEFYVEDASLYKSYSLKVASDDAAAVYINGILVDEDDMIKMHFGHDLNYWNREKDNLPSELIKPGKNVLEVLLVNTEESFIAFLDLMLLGNKK